MNSKTEQDNTIRITTLAIDGGLERKSLLNSCELCKYNWFEGFLVCHNCGGFTLSLWPVNLLQLIVKTVRKEGQG